MTSITDIVTAEIDRVSAATGQARHAIVVDFTLEGGGLDGGWSMNASLLRFTTRTGKKCDGISKAYGTGDTLAEAADELIVQIRNAVKNGSGATGGRIEVMK